MTISIHAPLTGSDWDGWQMPNYVIDFNPRSPYGERLIQTEDNPALWPFQSTLPLRGATSIRLPPFPEFSYFNPRSPYGERPLPEIQWNYAALFQSTLPLRGATLAWFFGLSKCSISIHAPLTGSDRSGSICFNQREDFNPRSPYGERRHV